MKKFLVVLLALVLALAMVACGGNDDAKDTDTNATSDTVADTVADTSADTSADTEGDEAQVMSYAEYVAAEIDAPVVIEAYVQAKQVYNTEYSNTSIYTQDEDGAYFVYRLPCTQEEYDSITVGSKIKVNGFKSEWSGEVEIVDATFELVEGNYIAEAVDVTELLGTDELVEKQNMFVAFTGLTVAPITDANGNEASFLYGWDGSGEKGADLYFNVSYNDTVYNFCVETDLCDSSTDVYAAVEGLNVGDTINLEGFLYWYEGVNPHITAVTVVE